MHHCSLIYTTIITTCVSSAAGLQCFTFNQPKIHHLDHVCIQTYLCLFLMLTWEYWPRWYPDGRSSDTQSPAGCCRHSAWSSPSVLGHRQQPPPPAVSPPEAPNLVGDKESLSKRDSNIASTPANPTISHPVSILTPTVAYKQVLWELWCNTSLFWSQFAFINMKRLSCFALALTH